VRRIARAKLVNRYAASMTLSALLFLWPCAGAAASGEGRTVVVLYPEHADGRPANELTDQSLRAAFAAAASEPIQARNEYLDLSRFQDAAGRRVLAEFLRNKYSGEKIDLVMAALAPSLTFALEHRQEIFPGVPIVFMAVDQLEVQKQKLPADVIGVPVKLDLAATLEVALRLHPRTRRVFVVTGSAAFDVYWEGAARQAFRTYVGRVAFEYLSQLSMDDLVKRVAHLPDDSIVIYLPVSRDAAGKGFIPADALKLLATAANAPMYGYADSYVGRGIVGGHVLSFEMEGKHAADLALRILAGERVEQISVPAVSPNVAMFDWRQLRRWGIREASLPPGSQIRFREPSLWDLYHWHIVGAISLFALQTVLIVALLAQMARRRRADEGLRRSQVELRILTGRLLQARESESRRIARELHDDLGQGLALLTVELDLLRHKLPDAADQLDGRLQALLGRAKQLSSSVHDLSHQLHPSKLEQLGLVAAIGSLCRELADAHGLKIEFSHDRMPAAISPDTAVCLYRIAQEGLGNAIKHGGARQAEVELRGTGDSIALRIIDHGRGFDPRQVQAGSGLGLVSMRERVLHLGGAIAIDSQSSGGTRLHVRVPLPELTPA
jgi:signal transduction histidine kinase